MLQAQEQRQMRWLNTRTSVNDVAQHKNMAQKKLRSIRTMTIEVVKYANKGK